MEQRDRLGAVDVPPVSPAAGAGAPLFPVVGLGASAGGLQALQTFFDHTPPDTGMAFVVVLHLSPKHESQAAALLQRHTSMPVQQVTAVVPLGPNQVFVIPPGQQLTMVDGHLRLDAPRSEQERHASIDHFFRTLADTHDSRAIAIILSGTGSDGTIGISHIKERGGAVFVQDPEEAEFTGMPRSAIATKLVDGVLSVAHLPERLRTYWQPAIARPTGDGVSEHDGAVLHEILAVLRVRTHHDFTEYKLPTVLRRIGRRMQVVGVTDMSSYLQVLRSWPDEVQALLTDLLISVTQFFRDPAAWAALQAIVPQLFKGKGPTDQVRVWVAACATGEEAYSVAMLLLEHALTLEHPPALQVFATDIDEGAIATARRGVYPETIAGDVSPERLRRFFVFEQGRYRVKQELRELVLFAAHNVLRDPPFTMLDLVTCRNLLIYLNHAAQEQVLDLFQFSLQQGGYLLLGTAESLDTSREHFRVVAKAQHLYQRVGRPVGPPLVPRGDNRSLPPPVRKPSPAPALPGGSVGDVHQQLLLGHTPPSALVNGDYAILHLSRGASRFLQLEGEVSTNLLHLAHPDLRLELQIALLEAGQHGRRSERRGVRVAWDDAVRVVDLLVEPVADRALPQGALLVLFQEGGVASETLPPVVSAGDGLVRELQAELERTREQLRLTVEQYATSTEEYTAANEELEAINEELRAATEELETSKEELSAVNEELQTVNQELKHTIDETTAANNDLQNLAAATEIATLFLDRELRLTRYTPAAETIFNLLPVDRGRPLAHVTHTLHYDQFVADAAQVLRTLTPIVHELASTRGAWYLVQLRPYRTTDYHIAGVVITFVDITARKRAEDKLRESEARQAFLLQLSDALRPLHDPVEIQGAACRVLGEHLGTDRAYYVTIDEARQEFVVARDWHQPGAPSHARRYPLRDWPMPWLVDGKTWVVRDTDTDPALPDDQRDAYRGNDIGAAVVVPLLKAQRLVATFVTNQRAPRAWTAHEVALVEETAERTWAAVERARAAAQVRESEERYHALFVSMDQGYAVVDVLADQHGAWNNFRFVEVNPAFIKQTGLHNTGRTATEILGTPNPHWAEIYGRVAETGEPVRFEEPEPTLGRIFDLYAFRLGAAGSQRVAVLFTDITERKQREMRLAEQARLLDLSNDAIIVRNVDNRIVYWNHGATELYGWSRAEAIGQDQHTLLRTEFELPFADLIATLNQHDRMEGEVVQVTKDGRRINTWSRWALDRDAEGRPGAILTTYNDITERKRAEERLRESEERFRAVAEVVPDLLWSSDAGGVIGWYNQRWYAYTGQTPEEALGGGWLAALHPQDREDSRNTFQRAIDGGQPLRHEHRIRGADGVYRWFLSQALPLRDEHGTIVRWYGAWADIHVERLALEAEQAARAEAEAALKAREQFLSIASHELRTPLTSLLGYAHMLPTAVKSGQVDPVKMTELITRQAQRLNTLIEQLLDVGRLQRGQFAIEPAPVDVVALVGHVVADVRAAQAPDTKHPIKLERPDAPVIVTGDGLRLEQVMQNLLSNAIKYSPSGGPIHVQVTHTATDAVLEVSDQGLGIPSESQARLFEAFFRAKNTGKQISGFGLGLHIAHEIVQRHGGRIEVESTEGVGSTFRVVLPLQP